LSNKILWKETGLVACHLPRTKKAGPMLLGWWPTVSEKRKKVGPIQMG
jgi:hypothetical protein